MVYIPHGPWTNASPPGVDASLLSDVEAALVALNNAVSDPGITSNGSGILSVLGLVNNDAGNTITGTTAGNATLYQFLRGNVKALFIYFNGYRNSGTTEQVITLPQAFTRMALVYAAGGSPGIHFWLSGTSQTSKITTVTAFPTPPGPGNATSGLSSINGFSQGSFIGGFDGIGLGISLPSTFTTGLFIIGS